MPQHGWEFFTGLGSTVSGGKAASLCRDLAGLYRGCAGQMDIAKEKNAAADARMAAPARGRDLDGNCADRTKELLSEIVL